MNYKKLQSFFTLPILIVLNLIVTALFGGVLFLIFWGMPRIIKHQVIKQTELEKGTEQWNRFEELPFPLQFSIRFFEVTNGADIINGSKPVLKETEPYVYKMHIKRENIQFDDEEEDSVTYTRNISFEFDATASGGKIKETDIVTIVNPILMATLQSATAIERLALAGCLDKILTSGLNEIFLQRSVKDLLFNGVNFGFANNSDLEPSVACKIVRNRIIEKTKTIRNIEHVTDDNTDYLRFTFFNYRTENYIKQAPDGIYTISRGRKQSNQLGSILRWNSNSSLTTWGSPYCNDNGTCNRIRGTDSTIFQPLLTKSDDLFIFNTDICRNIKLVYQSDESYRGIKGYHYGTGETLFQSTSPVKDTDCFCSKSTINFDKAESCYLDGVFDVKPCIGSPILISSPHFLYASKTYLNRIDGLTPKDSLHESYVLLEPNTGTPLEGKKRIQLNCILTPEPLIDFVTKKELYPAVFPILWLEEGVTLPQDYVDELNDKYFKVVKLSTGLTYGLLAFLAILLLVCLYCLTRKLMSKYQSK